MIWIEKKKIECYSQKNKGKFLASKSLEFCKLDIFFHSWLSFILLIRLAMNAERAYEIEKLLAVSCKLQYPFITGQEKDAHVRETPVENMAQTQQVPRHQDSFCVDWSHSRNIKNAERERQRGHRKRNRKREGKGGFRDEKKVGHLHPIIICLSD